MAIREDIILDPSKGIKGLDEMNRATMKYARKQDKLYKQNQKSIQAIEDELQKLRRVREASNNPKAVQKYTNTIEKLEKEQKQLRKETEKYSGAVKKTSKESQSSFQKMGKAAKKWIAGIAIGALLAMGETLRRISGEQVRFDQKMNESLAIMGDVSLGVRNQMEEAARAVSGDLNMAVDKAAESYFYLASAGLDAQQSMQALPAVAEFARAGMFDMATATDLATDSQSALGLTVDDSLQNYENLRRVTDVLVNANQDANASVQQFAEALTNRAATSLRNVNKELEEGVGVLAAYADQGIKGRRAGELFSRFLRITSRAAAQNTEQFQEMGIMTPDEELASLTDIVRGLTQELEGLTGPQQTARLEQLGFTAEVQEAIKPLLGLTDQIDEYTKSAYEAAGATKEVAENQLKSLNERAGQVWKTFKNKVGPTITRVMDGILSQIEQASQGLQTLIDKGSSANQELVNILQRADADPEIIAEVQTRIDLANAEELRSELEEQVSGFTVPVAVVEGSDPTEPFDVNVIGDSARNVGVEYAKSLLEGFRGELQNLPSQINEAVDRGATGRASYLRNRARALEDAITQTQEYINLQENLKATEEAIKSLRSEDPASPEEEEPVPSDETVEKTKGWIATLRRFGDTQEQLATLSSINLQSAGGAELDNALRLVTELDNRLSNIAQSDVIGAQMRGATENVRMYNEALTRVNNELNAGIITQEQYEQRVKEATDTYLSQIQEIYKTIKDQLSPAQQEMFEEMFGNFEDATEGGEDFKTNLDDIADTADAILNVADAFGAIGDNARKSLRGISDVLRNVQQIKNLEAGAGALSYAMPAIGVAGGLMSMLSGLGGGDDEPTVEMVNEIKSLNRAIKRNTEAIREQTVGGADITRGTIDKADQIINEIENLDIVGAEGENIGDLLNQLSELGIEAFEGIDADYFDSLVKSLGGGFEGYIQAFMDITGGRGDVTALREILNTFRENYGEYGQTLAAAIREFEDAVQFMGASASEAMDLFVDKISELDVDIPAEILQELEGIDLSTEEGRSRMQEIVQELFQNRDLFRGNLSPDEFSNLLDFLESQTEGASGSTNEGFSRSVQIARTITDVQANEMIMFLERIEAWTRATAYQLGADTGGLGFSVPGEAMQANSMSGMQNVLQSVNQSKTNSVSIGDISVNSNITDSEIGNILSAISRKLKQQIRGSQF